MKKILTAIVVVILVGIGILAALKLQSETPQNAETTPPQETTIVRETNDEETENLFDACLGLQAYENKPFYTAMMDTLQQATPPAFTEFNNDYYENNPYAGQNIIVDACYSEQLNTVILLTNTSYELGGASFGVYEYDINGDSVVKDVHPDELPYPTEFGSRDGQLVGLVNTVCAAEDSDAPANCKNKQEIYQYNLEENKIVE